MRLILTCAAAWMLAAAAAAEPSAPPAFAKKPAVTREGDKVKVEFAADRETDVAVYVENAKGEIVRHLVAGLLGKNPPEPLKAGSLAQSIEWDGKDDDGKPAADGPFKVRVGLGLKPSWGGTAFADKDKTGPNNIDCVWGLAAGPDGRVYAMGERNGGLVSNHNAIHVFRRDGSYEKTIRPFPANIAPGRVAAVNAFVPPGGTLTPVVHSFQDSSFYPETDTGKWRTRGQHMAVTPSGQLLIGVEGNGMVPHLAAIDGDGGIPNPSYSGPALLAGEVGWFTPFMAASADGKYVYVTGMGGPRGYDNAIGVVYPNSPAVYRAKLPERGPAEVFFGERAKAGNDEKHLDEPRGLAVDGKGQLLVADRKNNRVVVLKESDGGFVASFPVPAPGWVGVSAKTGAVYVQSGVSRAQYDKAGPGEVQVIKFSGWKDAKEVGRVKLPPSAMGHPSWTPTLTFALDASAEPTVLWVGRSTVADTLLRCEDRGGSFSDWTPAAVHPPATARFPHVSTDPLRRTVMGVVENYSGSLVLQDDATGERRQVKPSGGLPKGYSGQWDYGATYRLGLGGRIYRMACGGFVQFGPDGKYIPFPATGGGLQVLVSGTNGWERTIGTDRQGNIYVMNRGEVYHGLHKVDKYSNDGKILGTVLWAVTDGMLGPRLDARGNLYIADSVKPLGKKWPEEFDGRLPASSEWWYNWTYGSLIKFSPKGGAFWVGDGKGMWTLPYEQTPQFLKDFPWAKDLPFPTTLGIDPSLAKEPVETYHHDPKLKPTLQGALWRYFGVGGMMTMTGMGGAQCHCTYTDFDTDDFGRSFVMDQLRFRISVVDTNGNVVRHIGAYGNQDFCGPDSYVLDPKEKYYRPRKSDDPKDLKSPFAEPEIAFSWIVSAAVTDRNLYVADSVNRRVLRVKLDYAAVETAAVP